MSSYVAGIDPDLVKSGVAVVKDGRLWKLESLDLYELIDFIRECKEEGAHIVIEDVESMRPTFPRNLKAGNRTAQIAKISQNVGQVKAIARVVCLYLDKIGASYTKVKPLTGAARYTDANGHDRVFRIKDTKGDAELFNKVTGWAGRSNEDKRDAAMLALYGPGRA